MAERNAAWRADPELSSLARRLNEIVADIGLSAILVMDDARDCVAEGNEPALPNFTGANYSDREYFIAPRNGHNGRQVTVGRVTDSMSIVYTSPVVADGRFVGAIGVRINLTSLYRLVIEERAFVTDQNGVVILARDPDLLMRAIPGAGVFDRPVTARQQQYKKNDFETLDFSSFKKVGASQNLVRWNGREEPYVMATHTIPGEILSVHVLREFREIANIQQERLWSFVLVSLAGVLLFLLVSVGFYIFRTNRLHRQELERQARTDALTGCANRRSFLDALEAEQRRGSRYASPFSVLSLDIDHFKRINDQHGHPAGDHVLRHFVSLVENILRPTDMLGRMGGEEFAVLLPQTTNQEAALIAERIRTTLDASPASFAQATIPVTVSIGVAQWQDEEGEPIDHLLSRTDTALYAAKNGGRNQVSVFP